MKGVHITNDIYYVGVNDRKKHLFENNWPLPHGVSYNSYLVKEICPYRYYRIRLK